MAKNQKAVEQEETALAAASDFAMNLDHFFEQGFSEEKTISLGDPDSGKHPFYFGELIGEGEPVSVERQGGKADPNTGVIPVDYLRTYVFNPLDPRTFTAYGKVTHRVICSHQAATICAGALKRAEKEGGRAQVLFRWNGKIKTRKGNFMNDFSSMVRIMKDGTPTTTFDRNT